MNAESSLDFPGFLALLRRHVRLIVGIGVLAGVLAFAVSSLFPDKYDASADVLFRQPSTAPRVDPEEPPAEISSEPERVAATNLALASLDVVALQVADSEGIEKSAEELRDSVSIEPKGQADVVTITARADSPDEAALVANAFADNVVALRRDSARSKIQDVIGAIEAQLAEDPPDEELAEQLEARASQLEVQKRLEAGDAEVVEEATPPENPASPKPLRNAGIGVVLGLILGVVLALLMRRLDRRVGSDDEVVEIVGAPVVGRIPAIEQKAWQQGMAVEAFHLLRANLQLGGATADARIMAFTSGLPEEGKSTVVLQLAEALAASGSSVILVDCDIRRPMLHRLLGVAGVPGVTDVLSSGSKPGDSLVETDVAGLKLLPAGPMTDLPGVMPGGEQKLEDTLKELAAEADYVLVDTAPVTIGADASTVAAAVDSAFLVVDATSIDREVLAAASEQLHRAEANVAGVVLNRSKGVLSDSAYQGYYAGTMPGVGKTMPAPVKKRR